MWIGPIQLNNPVKGIKSMEPENIAPASIYIVCIVGLSVCAYVQSLFDILWPSLAIGVVLILNQLGLWSVR